MTDPLIDERLALPITQAAFLWCIRMHVLKLTFGIEAEPRIEDVLRQLGACQASPVLRRFMITLSQGATRMIDVGCVCQPRISLDEHALLDVLGLAQASRPFEAMLILRGFAAHQPAGNACGCAQDIGAILTRAGRLLPAPEDEMRHFALTSGRSDDYPTSPTLH